MQAWQVLASAGLGDGDAAAPQAAAPRPLGNAADVLQLLEDAPHSAPGRAPVSLPAATVVGMASFPRTQQGT